jgi:hypothetical protein
VSARPGSSRPSAKLLGQGLATWALFVAFGRLGRPLHWVLGQVRRALFNWKDYTRYIREQTVVEGVFGGRKLWLALGAVLWGARALRRASGGTERVVLREVIQPGERIVITQIPRKLPRKERRAAAKAS